MLKEYPRPQFRREEWLSLNGSWDFEFDDKNVGLREKWYANKRFSRKIEVPYVYECKLSGIGDPAPHRYFWYKKRISLPSDWKGKRIFVHFNAVDYAAKIFVNGEIAGVHTGGNTAFSVEITRFLGYQNDELCVYVEDDPFNECQPRGKQFWEEKPREIWYTRSSGIWQSVFLECVNESYIKDLTVKTDIDSGEAAFVLRCDAEAGAEVRLRALLNGKDVAAGSARVQDGLARLTLDVFHGKIMNCSTHSAGLCWSPENPVLFDVEIELIKNGKRRDFVTSYFGMREISVKDGEIYLNHHKYFMRLVLDQGYFPDGLLTPACDEDLSNDIIIAKKMGFNGCRKHQKVECELFHYYADKLGFLVWGETANCANFDAVAAARFQEEWADSVIQRINHPCIVAWVPLNESWGVPNLRGSEEQRAHALSLYYLTKMLDPSRPVISNDGWEMVKTDLIGIHNYAHGGKDDFARQADYVKGIATRSNLLYRPSTNRSIFVGEFGDEGQPILLTEMGGASYGKYDGESYGYSEVKNEAELIAFLERVFKAIYASEEIKGFCYTQLADVEQEINGLLTKDRKPKADVERIARAVTGRFK